MKKKLASFFAWFKPSPESRLDEPPKIWSKRKLAAQALQELEPLLNRRFNPMYASVIKLEVLTPNIRKFNLMLQGFSTTVHLAEIIQKSDCVFTKTETTLDKFFTDEDRLYIGQEELKCFHQEATRLCALTEKGELAEYGIDEHNFRILTKVFVGIKQVCDAVVATNNMR